MNPSIICDGRVGMADSRVWGGAKYGDAVKGDNGKQHFERFHYGRA